MLHASEGSEKSRIRLKGNGRTGSGAAARFEVSGFHDKPKDIKKYVIATRPLESIYIVICLKAVD